jgi:DNA-binding transcriptional MerR regulator
MKRYVLTMDTQRTYLATEAGTITGVSAVMQRDWRRRELLPPPEDVGWIKFDYAYLGRLRLQRYFAERGMVLGKAAHLAEHLAQDMGNALAAALAEQAGKGPYAKWIAYLITRPNEGEVTEAGVVCDLAHLLALNLRHQFDHLELVPLAPLAREMAARIHELDQIQERKARLVARSEAVESRVRAQFETTSIIRKRTKEPV